MNTHDDLWLRAIKDTLWYVPLFLMLAGIGVMIGGRPFLNVALVAFPIVYVITLFHEHSILIEEHNESKGSPS